MCPTSHWSSWQCSFVFVSHRLSFFVCPFRSEASMCNFSMWSIQLLPFPYCNLSYHQPEWGGRSLFHCLSQSLLLPQHAETLSCYTVWFRRFPTSHFDPDVNTVLYIVCKVMHLTERECWFSPSACTATTIGRCHPSGAREKGHCTGWAWLASCIGFVAMFGGFLTAFLFAICFLSLSGAERKGQGQGEEQIEAESGGG